jgi:hypothetical protein
MDRLRELAAKQLLGVVWIMHEVYGAYDLCSTLMADVDGRGESGIASAYESLLTTIP